MQGAKPPKIAAIQLYRMCVSLTCHVASYGAPSGWPSHMLDIAATSACAERYVTISRLKDRKEWREEKTIYLGS
jgi:hypothetical protein